MPMTEAMRQWELWERKQEGSPLHKAWLDVETHNTPEMVIAYTALRDDMMPELDQRTVVLGEKPARGGLRKSGALVALDTVQLQAKVDIRPATAYQRAWIRREESTMGSVLATASKRLEREHTYEALRAYMACVDATAPEISETYRISNDRRIKRVFLAIMRIEALQTFGITSALTQRKMRLVAACDRRIRVFVRRAGALSKEYAPDTTRELRYDAQKALLHSRNDRTRTDRLPSRTVKASPEAAVWVPDAVPGKGELLPDGSNAIGDWRKAPVAGLFYLPSDTSRADLLSESTERAIAGKIGRDADRPDDTNRINYVVSLAKAGDIDGLALMLRGIDRKSPLRKVALTNLDATKRRNLKRALKNS